MAIHFSALSFYSYLCSLEQAGQTTPEIFSEQPRIHGKTERSKQIGKVAFNTAITKIKDRYPNRPVKPVP